MAETEEAVPNGTGGLSAEEEDERLKQRPADIDADVREMERRKRVEAIMSSRLFREELERVLDQQLSEGGGAAPLLQRIREMVGAAGAARLQAGAFKGGNCVLPINDIRGMEGMGYEKGEKILRCKLAAVYRLVDLYGWTQAGLSGQITARLNTAVEHFLTAPRGLLPHEVTASSLVKVDMQGVVQDQGTTNFPVNLTGFSLHACVHAARPDVRCVLHVRSPAALAVSAQRDGLLPLSSEAALLGDVAYHHNPPGALDNEERDKLVRALGPTAKVLVLANGGALCCGETLEEAFHQARCLTAACDVQLRLAAVPLERLSLLDDDARKQIYEASRRPPADGAKWRVGGEEFEALMRMLDNAGYRTGYIYRHPLVKGDVPKPKNDVEVPPAVSSLGYLLEEEELYRQGLWKKMPKAGDRTRWLNSPNVYQKVEVLETGTNDPKKITKWVDANNEEWVQDGSPAHSGTPVKIDVALQFVPKGTNPKEFKQLQQQIKDNRRADKISAGPQSHILEGVTWDEANKLNAEDAAATHTGDHVVLMGAASKGIIQRGYQHNATVYSAPYARNPFEQVSERDLDDYKRTIERKARGDYDADVSESEGVSAAQLTSPDCQPSETEEESRDEHRILRIETKQAPRPSQPEVVLSDDTTDFLAAERRAAERSPKGDSAVFSDDEVFHESAGAAAAGQAGEVGVAGAVRVGGGVLADGGVLVRSYRAPVQQTAVKGYKAPALPKHTSCSHASTSNPATITQEPPVFTTNQRSLHEYPRSPNFQNVVKIFENNFETELEKSTSLKHSRQPRCKTSLNMRLVSSENTLKAEALEVCVRSQSSDRSSLYSVPSIEWDSVRKNDLFRTRSLPRRSTNKTLKLFRTRSHAGFANAYIGDPDPTHFHLPRCRSCGSFNSSYAWELYDRRSRRSSFDSTLCASQSSCNIQTTCRDRSETLAATITPTMESNSQASDTQTVRVNEKTVPVLNALIINKAKTIAETQEWVECQEFTDDNLEDVGESFSSENLTVIEKSSPKSTEDFIENVIPTIEPSHIEHGKVFSEVLNELKEKLVSSTVSEESMGNSLEPEVDSTSDRSDNMEDFGEDPMYGEYLNYSDELDFEDTVYESPVKDLVVKDIRNYSVPMTVYCDDFSKFVQNTSYRRSPAKIKVPVMEVVLEPILEESKSSYGEESSTLSDKVVEGETNYSSVVLTAIEEEIIYSANGRDHENNLMDNIEQRKMLSDTIINAVSIVDEIVLSVFKSVKNELENLDNETLKNIESDKKAKLPLALQTKGPSKDVNRNLENQVDTLITYSDSKKIKQLPGQKTHHCFPEDSLREESITHEDIVILHRNDKLTDDFVFKVPKASQFNSSSTTSSSIRDSFDSTVEFERIETVSEVLGMILDRVSMNNQLSEELHNDNKDFLDVVSRRKVRALESPEKIYDTWNHNANEGIKKGTQDQSDIIILHSAVDSDYADINYIDSKRGCMQPEDIDLKIELHTKPQVNVELNDTEFSIPADIIIPIIEKSVHAKNSNDDSEPMEHFLKLNEAMNNTLDLTYTVVDVNKLPFPPSSDSKYQSELDNSAIANEMNQCKEFHKSRPSIDNYFERELDGCFNEEMSSSKAEIYLDVSTKSFDTDNPMDMGFVEGSYRASITSSPYDESGDRESAIQELDQSPIRNDNLLIPRFDSQSLYESEDSILSSPFIKKAPIITMSHKSQRGGIKFWISFDDSISPREEQPLHRHYRSFEKIDDKTPSFLVTEFADKITSLKKDRRSTSVIDDLNVTIGSIDTIMVANNTLTDSYELLVGKLPEPFEQISRHHRSVLCRSMLDEDASKSREELERDTLFSSLQFEKADSFKTAKTSSGSYITCELNRSKNLYDSAQCPTSSNEDLVVVRRDRRVVKKLYDSSRVGRIGRGFSWPPFEDTLFYRILSKFRMSESFDPNEFEKLCS